MALEAKLPDSSRRLPSPGTELPTDEAILIGLEQRAPWAAEALFDRLDREVDRTLYRVLQRRSDDFTELVRLTFSRLVCALTERKFSTQRNLTTWASTIAVQVALEWLRAKVRASQLVVIGPTDPSDPDERELLLRSSTRNRLELRPETGRAQTALAEMNPAQAETLFLHDVLGHDLAAIAETTQVTVAAVRSRLVRGRKDFLRRAEHRNSGGRRP